MTVRTFTRREIALLAARVAAGAEGAGMRGAGGEGSWRLMVASRWTYLSVIVLLVLTVPGCVQRRFTIRSNPPGARVYVDDYELGTTPVSSDFVYYGTRKIRLVKDGYETLTVEQRIGAPWYEWFPLDFVSENLIPGEIRDDRCFTFQLVPQRIVPTTELVGRAENLRRANQTGAPVIPLDEASGNLPTPRSSPGYLDPGFVPRELVLPRRAPQGAGVLPPPEAPGTPLPPATMPGGGAAPPATAPQVVPGDPFLPPSARKRVAPPRLGSRALVDPPH